MFALRLLLSTVLASATFQSWVTAQSCAIIDGSQTLSLFVDPAEKQVVKTALELFASDVGLVNSNQPLTFATDVLASSVVAGSVANPSISSLIQQKGVDVADITGKWEAYKIFCFEATGGKPVLLVAGSDPRGTAYGVLELSRQIGVGPWSWWADVTPNPLNTFSLPIGYTTTAKPSVQYRGIFLNDEDWGLRPWSVNTFEPGVNGRIGPKTYEKIFELLLRLRANTIWPAMHTGTIPFYGVPGSKEASDKFGIVVGTSHAEPMLTNPSVEWNSTLRGSYNWITNKAGVMKFWRDRLEQTRGSDVIVTIGMRGLGDGPMQGVSGTKAAAAALADVIDTQRKLLAEYYPITQPPQVFIPYKEVLDIYNYGLKVPDNVTLAWCDDNYSYMTRLSNSTEQRRIGGGGIYFHVSYWGRPHDYLWLGTTHPSLIYYQMRRAFDFNSQKMWILNVGDIKPAEYLTEFYLDMAWDINAFTPTNLAGHLVKWASREFGSVLGPRITNVMSRYYDLATLRKPEHMGWSQTETATGSTPVIDTEFNPFAFGDEIAIRVDAYSALQSAVRDISASVAANQKNAFYQLVEYPVNGAALLNKKLLYAQKARLFAKYNLTASGEYAALASGALTEIGTFTTRYNTLIAGGKWKSMMPQRPRNLFVFDPPPLPKPVTVKKGVTVVWPEYEDKPIAAGVRIAPPIFVRETQNDAFVAVFLDGESTLTWTIESKPSWLLATLIDCAVKSEKKIKFSASWAMITKDSSVSCTLVVNGLRFPMIFTVKTFNQKANGHQFNTLVAIDGSNYLNAAGAQVVAGLGHSGSSVILSASTSAYLEYSIWTTATGAANITTYVMPNQPVALKGDIRISVSVDNGAAQTLSFLTPHRSEDWKLWVLRNQTPLKFKHTFATAGLHKIKIKALDEGIVVDQLLVDFKTERKFYVVPVMNRPETAATFNVASVGEMPAVGGA
ncbi:hypothetical protein DFJ77DRAFT_552235 [Powellomyces hirtus]|nr:hypothetical protein DFJ77DRAFT_552235 [Powellomyces hirtus]